MEYGSDTTKISALAAGTAYAFTSTQQQFLVDYLLNGQQWFGYAAKPTNTQAAAASVTRPGTSTLALSLIPAVQNALASGVRITKRNCKLCSTVSQPLSQPANPTRPTNSPAIGSSGIRTSWSSSGPVITRR